MGCIGYAGLDYVRIFIVDLWYSWLYCCCWPYSIAFVGVE